jgi:molybdopterin synthase catalytic subunit
MKKEPKNIFIKGRIESSFIAESIAKHASQTAIGGHSLFLGQVRKDPVKASFVSAIEYTAHEEMALEKMHEIREDIFKKYELTCMHIYHSLGMVNTGEICLFIFTSSAHRKPAIEACNELVERIKAELPIWGKEILENEEHQWKVNQ